MKVTFDHKQQLNQEISTYYFQKPITFHYTAGQFIELSLPIGDTAKQNNRWFTLSSSPTETFLSITTRHPKQLSSFKQQLSSLQPGQTVDMSQAMGDFVLPKDLSIPIIFVAAGIGVTPIRSMSQHVLDTHQKRTITTLYIVRDKSDACFTDTLELASSNFHLIDSSSPQDITALTELLKQYVQPHDSSRVYLSGPESLVEMVDHALITDGFAREHIQTDFFPGYKQL